MDPAPITRPKPRTQLLVLAFAMSIALVASLMATAAEAQGKVRLGVRHSANSPARLFVTAKSNRPARRVAFYVNGRRRAVRHSRSWRTGRKGVLRLRNLAGGHLRVTVRAIHRRGRVSRATQVVNLATTSARGGKRRDTKQGIGKGQRVRDSSTDTTVEPEAEPASEPTLGAGDSLLLDAGFEDGLRGWSLAGVGDVDPTVANDIVDSGSWAGRVAVSGSQGRSELILGGDGTASTSGIQYFHEGDERFYSFSFNVQSMIYGRPGAHNLVMQFKSDGTGSPAFGLQLWDYEGDDGKSGGRGLWTHGEAMGGDRFLRPIEHGRWYDVGIHFKASRENAGFYRLFLNGELVDARDGVSMIRPDRSYAYIKNGIYRNRSQIPGDSEIRLDSARLGTSMEQILGS